jgi:HSP20 family protein
VSPEAVDVYVMVPGVDSDSLDVSIQQNLLTISGNRTVEPPQDENTNIYLQERFSGAFKRTINLPDDVDPERVEANSRDGVLRVTIHRREEAKPRQIEVK